MSETKTMTRPELSEFVSATVRGMLGSEMADLIRENIEKAVGPLRQQVTDYGAKIASAASPYVARPEREKGLALARCVRAVAAAKLNGSGVEGAVGILRTWGDTDLAEAWVAARQKALTAGDATAGGTLVPTQFSTDFIELLRSVAVMRKLGVTTLPLPVGNITLPKATGGATAGYIGETSSDNIAKSQLSTGDISLKFKKLAVLTPISNSLLRYSSPGADAIVRNDLLAAMAVKEDGAFIRGQGSDASPKGLYWWAPGGNRIAANTTVNAQNVATDLGKLIEKLLSADVPMIKPAWILAPRVYAFLVTVQASATSWFMYRDEMVQNKTLWGYPFAITTGVPTNLDATGAGNNDESELYFFDAGQAIIGEAEGVMVDTSSEAAYHDGSAVQAAFSKDQTVVRAIAEHDFAMRHDLATAVLTGVDWKPGSI